MATTDAGASSAGAKKLRRITRACDYCHKRSIRCRFPGADDTRCQNCIDFDQPCRFERVVKRRGAKPRSQTFSSDEATVSVKEEPGPYQDFCRTPSIPAKGPIPGWKAPKIASQAVVLDLVLVYFEIIHPIFPYFHRPTTIRRVSNGDYLFERFEFSAIMAMCAIATARIADKALYNPNWDTSRLLQVKSEDFYAAAVKECGNVGALDAVPFDLLRSCALLCVTAIQYNRHREFQIHLGKYHTMMGCDMLHDEQNWPSDIGIVETEMRRRLYWSMYCLDIYSAIVWNGVVRSREQQSNVSYPTELDDDYFDDDGYNVEALTNEDSRAIIRPSSTHMHTDVRSSSWLCGWNFITDLNRITEHVITNFRDRHQHRRSFLTDMLGVPSTASSASVGESIMAMYNNLPQCFRDIQAITYDMSRDRYGFQAANITVTVQLLRMILCSSSGVAIGERCRITSESVDAFMLIPIQYLQALSSPLLHHLACIGTILGSVFDEQLSETDYLQIRVVLLTLAQLLDNMDHGVYGTASAEKLRDLVIRIDQYMRNQRSGRPSSMSTNRTTSSRAFSNSPYNLSRGTLDGSSSASHNLSASTSAESSHTNLHGGRSQAFTVSNALFENWPWNGDLAQYPPG